jgi:hypothetical protein
VELPIIVEIDDMQIFSPVEEVMRTGTFIDPQRKAKLQINSLITFNPLKELKATMGVALLENQQMKDDGGAYHSINGSVMSKQQFEHLKSLG